MPADAEADCGATEMAQPNRTPRTTQSRTGWFLSRLRKHADYQRVYRAGRKQFSKEMSYFFALRPALGPDGTLVRDVGCPEAARVGLTVGKAMGKAVDRNRIKRRMREAVRRELSLLRAPVDVVLHPGRGVLGLDSAILEREVAKVFLAVQRAAEAQRSAQRGGTQSLAANDGGAAGRRGEDRTQCSRVERR